MAPCFKDSLRASLSVLMMCIAACGSGEDPGGGGSSSSSSVSTTSSGTGGHHVVAPVEVPLYITTSSPLSDTYAGMSYSSQIVKTGGTSSPTWSINPGGVNTAWLTIDAATGLLAGVPSETEIGPVSVTVHVEEPTLPSNFAEATFAFNVKSLGYHTSFEGACPDGWTLAGDWECGVPMNVGPTPYEGMQCLGTQIAGKYNDLQTFADTTATSPDIDLTGVPNARLTFQMWVETEGATYDGFNVRISTNGGTSYTILSDVVPPYQVTIGGDPAWGGHQSTLGWQFVQADLSAYAGQTIRLRFAFQSDTSGIWPGVYIDDLSVE